MSNTLIIILGLAGAALLLGGVGFSAYSRIKRMGQSGLRLSDLLDKLEESLEEDDQWLLPPESKRRTLDGKAAPSPDKKSAAKDDKEASTKDKR